MPAPQKFWFPVRFERDVPIGAIAYRAGYSALIGAYGLQLPLPLPVFATGSRHREYKELGLHVLSTRHAPAATLEGHLTFALKYEGAKPEILKALFAGIAPEQIEQIVRGKPTGQYARRIWFLYEWLTGRALDLPDQQRGSYVNAWKPHFSPSRHRATASGIACVTTFQRRWTGSPGQV